MSSSCPICRSATTEHGRGEIRHQYERALRRCERCGFVFIENVTWLEEAYAEPINVSDTGYVARNILCRDRVRTLIELLLNPNGRFLDHAAGYGMFRRLMRDAGYDFRWSDLYCENLFARGFEAPDDGAERYEAVTAFEVFEHWVNPLEEITKLVALTDCLIFSTVFLPQPAPAPDKWWYYGLDHGQHVSFFSRQTFEFIAGKLGFHFVSNGSDFHMLAKRPISESTFKRVDRRLWRFWIGAIRQRPSLTWRDHEDVRSEE